MARPAGSPSDTISQFQPCVLPFRATKQVLETSKLSRTQSEPILRNGRGKSIETTREPHPSIQKPKPVIKYDIPETVATATASMQRKHVTERHKYAAHGGENT